MTSIFESASGGKSSSDRTKTSPTQSASMAPLLTTSPPQNLSPLVQRKDDHAHRKRNRIVVLFVVEDLFKYLVVMRSMSKKKIEM